MSLSGTGGGSFAFPSSANNQFAIIANYIELYVQGSQEIKTGPGAVLIDMMNREAARRGITLSKH
jgi:hypothetical protein